MFFHILLFIFFLNMTDASAVSFSVLSVDTKESCQSALTVDPSDELKKEAEVEAIIVRFHNSRNYYRIVAYSYLEKHLAINLVELLDGDVGLAAKKLGIDFPALYRWVTIYEIDNGVRIRSIEATEEEKAYAVWLVEEYDGNVETVSKELRIDPQILRRWVNEYQEKKNAQIRDHKVSKRYTYKIREHAISKVIKNGGNMSVVAKELNIPKTTLRGWIIKYEERTGEQIRDTGVTKTYTDEEKAYAINRVKELGGNVSVASIELSVSETTLHRWIIKYEEESGEQIRNTIVRDIRTYTDKERVHAINRVKKLGGNISAVARELDIPVGTLRAWIIKYEEESGEQIRNVKLTNKYTDEEKAHAINRIKEVGGNISAVARELDIPVRTLQHWIIKYEERTGEQIRDIGVAKKYTDEKKAHAINRVKELGGNISEVAKKLDIPVQTLHYWIVRYEEEIGEQIRDIGVAKKYTDEEKAHAINKVRELGGNVSVASTARELDIPVETLRGWIIKYEERTGEQIRDIGVAKKYTDEEKAHAINRVKEVGGNVSVASTARELDIPVGTLRDWIIKYEERTGEQIRDIRIIRKTYTDEEKAHAINKVRELGGNMSVASKELNIPVGTLRYWVIIYEEESGEQIRNVGHDRLSHRSFTDEFKKTNVIE